MRISVIIPTYNEAEMIAHTVTEVKRRSDNKLQEIIVVDGGSSDNTVTEAREAGARVFLSPQKGRSAQMNYGAKKASGAVLYFLHADTVPPFEFEKAINRALAEGFSAGCFRLNFDIDYFLLNIYAWFTRFDVNAFRFGDQSLFVTRTVFGKTGGYREDHIVMEDNDMVRRIKEEFSFKLIADSVTTSARKYLQAGVLKLQMVFILIYILYMLGISQETLVKIYKKTVQ